jgi:hypothetical protein
MQTGMRNEQKIEKSGKYRARSSDRFDQESARFSSAKSLTFP